MKYILIMIFLHTDGRGTSSTESMTSVTNEFRTKQQCENAAAEIYRQKTSDMRVMWTCQASEDVK